MATSATPPTTAHLSQTVLIQNNATAAFNASLCKARTEAKFAFARIKGEVYLVQGKSSSTKFWETEADARLLPVSVVSRTEWETASAFTTMDVNIFRHEFIAIFRWSHQMTLHPNDIRILEHIDDQCIRYEEENGTVFMAKDVMERLRKNFMGRRSSVHGRLPWEKGQRTGSINSESRVAI